MTQNALLTFREILDLTKYKSRSTIMRKVAAGTFPPPIKVGGNAIRWRQSDVMQWEGGLPPQRY